MEWRPICSEKGEGIKQERQASGQELVSDPSSGWYRHARIRLFTKSSCSQDLSGKGSGFMVVVAPYTFAV
jgi:hypothetical protein